MGNKGIKKINVKNMENKIILITGANNGIGFEVSKQLSESNATIILACRSLEKGELAKTKIKEFNKNAKLDLMQLDLSSKKNIINFSKEFKKKYQRLDVLVNNAGLYEDGLNEDNFDIMMYVNYMGPFLLTNLLLNTIRNTKDSIILNNTAHTYTRGVFDLFHLEGPIYEGKKKSKAQLIHIYSNSKFYNVLFTFELQRRLQELKSDTMVNAIIPGVAYTGLLKNFEVILIF
jgi:NAD(P)-dependent dehydrogenase (short-subunit alcohol dehydrogenase family)